jgi:hypothetical protein
MPTPRQLRSRSMLQTPRVISEAARKPFPTAKSTEVYGFVLWILSMVCFSQLELPQTHPDLVLVLYVLWAFIPDEILVAMGVTYYPDKYWAIAIPSFVCMFVLFVFALYVFGNLYITQSLDSRHTIQGKSYLGRFSCILLQTSFPITKDIEWYTKIQMLSTRYMIYQSISSTKSSLGTGKQSPHESLVISHEMLEMILHIKNPSSSLDWVQDLLRQNDQVLNRAAILDVEFMKFRPLSRKATYSILQFIHSCVKQEFRKLRL